MDIFFFIMTCIDRCHNYYPSLCFSRRWVIGIAVVGGLLAIAIIVIIVLCIIKKKNMERAKIYTGDRPGNVLYR